MADYEDIGLETLDRLLDENETVLVEVLSNKDYQMGHIPGAINIPLQSENFTDEFQQTVPRHDTPIVVYCQNRECPTSSKAAKRLTQMGYANVHHYEGGKEGWRDAGRDLEQKVREVQADIG